MQVASTTPTVITQVQSVNYEYLALITAFTSICSYVSIEISKNILTPAIKQFVASARRSLGIAELEVITCPECGEKISIASKKKNNKQVRTH